MIRHPAFRVEPWALHETALRPGHAGADRVAVRALQWPHRAARQPRRGRAARAARHLPRTASTSSRPLPYAEAGYGFPESGQTLINVTNGKLFRLLVDDEPFDVRYGELRAHERVLDFRAGTLTRTRGVDLAGGPHRARDLRAAGVVHAARDRRHLSTRSSRSTARSTLVVQSELVANEQLPQLAGATRGSPRCSSRRSSPRTHRARARRRVLVHRTKQSGLRVAAAMDHVDQRLAARPRRVGGARPTARASPSPTCSSRDSASA